jgi:hypothetical protein
VKGVDGVGIEMRNESIPANGVAVALTDVTLPEASASSSINDAEVLDRQPGG